PPGRALMLRHHGAHGAAARPDVVLPSRRGSTPRMPDPEDHRLALDLLIRGFQVSRIIRLAADLGLADRIAPEGASPIAALAEASGVLPHQLLRVVRALAAFGIFQLDAV